MAGQYCPPKEHLTPEEVVKTLISNGAFVALAHPFQYKFGDKKTEELIAYMTDLGMKGLEVYHSSNNKLESMKLREMASRHHLLPTGGSDFHGRKQTGYFYWHRTRRTSGLFSAFRQISNDPEMG